MLVFRNPGLIDLDAALTMGVSVKEGDTPIGYFGTGLKFAVATILRNGGSVIMWRGQKRHEFAIEPVTIRSESFDMVTMDGARLGFTTRLGRDWEPWMAFREMASNCRDESGSYFLSRSSGTLCADHADGHTTFYVSGLDDVWPDRESILLESEPIMANEFVEVHPGHGDFIFYRGVRIATPMRPTMLRYNIRRPIALTEDRTAKWDFELHHAIERGIGGMSDPVMLREVMTCGETHLEHHLDLAGWTGLSPQFMEIAGCLGMGAESNPSLNPSVAKKARKLALKGIKEGDGVTLPPVKAAMLERACRMLTGAGYDVRAFPIIVMDSLGAGIMGLADEGRILLSRVAFEKGTRELAATLIEEYAHLRSGQGDFTRGFQDWIFDHLLAEIERGHGEPF